MSDEEITTNNPMDIDIVLNESSPAPATPTVVLDLGIGSGYISGSDDEDMNEPVASKSSTPDSTTVPTPITKKPLTTKKHPLTKTKSSLVNYERDSDDDEHTDDDEEEESPEQDEEIEEPNSNSGVILHATEDSDPMQMGTITSNEQRIVTSDLLNVTPFRADDASPSSHADSAPTYPLIFPEDADIRIPPRPTKTCSAKLEKKFEEYYKRFKKTGIDQNAHIQELKEFRNPSMYEKVLSHLEIDETGTNFPQELYDPHWWNKESYYEELSKAQKLEMEKRERERSKIAFIPGVKKIDQLGVGSSK